MVISQGLRIANKGHGGRQKHNEDKVQGRLGLGGGREEILCPSKQCLREWPLGHPRASHPGSATSWSGVSVPRFHIYKLGRIVALTS